MRKLLSLVLMLALCSTAWAANIASLNPVEQGIQVTPRVGLQYNHDGSFENGVAWQNAGCVAPDYGAFGECYDLTGEGMITGVTFWLTQVGNFTGQPADIYVWEGSPPGNVLAVVPGHVFQNIAFWPEVSQHEVAINVPVNGIVTVGFWGNWPGVGAPFYVGADYNNAGCPWTKIAPDVGYPEGWQSPNLVWPEVTALGIGVTTQPSTATTESSWSAINSLY